MQAFVPVAPEFLLLSLRGGVGFRYGGPMPLGGLLFALRGIGSASAQSFKITCIQFATFIQEVNRRTLK
ncbi:hypothetical protein [Lewinella sp. IMCC34183]|uniref:hypothetical protein n=1 Tax=Lewinella sp. IMCC34183 TaxID=2248762 RepID=UPI00130058D2|nr:hypothetical protein [Lewinella sp. IMCC34183]